MTEIRIYFEGSDALRPGFHEFLKEIREKARALRIGFDLVACGGTPERDYAIASKQHSDAWNILLRDSEGQNLPVTPVGSRFWMVELMEAWFLADPDALEQYYGDKFKRKALKKKLNVEEIPKVDVESCLVDATKGTQRGRYHKTKHAPHLLTRISPQKVRKCAPNCERLFATVIAKLEE